MNPALILVPFVALAGSALPMPSIRPPAQPAHNQLLPCNPQTVQATKRVEVVFVLDTTGSMGGLIEGAKRKIWSIATHIAQAQPSPTIRMGLVGYRDRGDEYVTVRTALTENLDALYSDLLAFQARGGGDTPESVNQALFEAVERFEWTPGPDTLRIIYLVGDAPPQTGYGDDVDHPASCLLAREKGIFINTIQCGDIAGTREVWQAIAQHAGGAYAAVPQDGGTQVVATPYDTELASLDRELASLMIDYGSRAVVAAQSEKRALSDSFVGAIEPEAAADRAVYNQTASGRSNLYGRQELVFDVVEEGKGVESIPAEQLPESLRGKTAAEIRAVIDANNARRQQIRTRMDELAAARAEYQAKGADDAPADSFDQQVLGTLRRQGASAGLSIGAGGAED